MRAFNEQSSEFEKLSASLRASVQLLIGGVPVQTKGLKIHAQSKLDLSDPHSGDLFLIREGLLSCYLNGKPIFTYEEGDLVGLERYFGLQGFELRSDFAVLADQFSYEELKKRGSGSNLESFQFQYCGLLSLIISSLVKIEGELAPTLRYYEQDEVIIEQNAPGDRVFNLVEGHADVSVDGVRVGEVLEDEIFGALAALTDSARTATVTATKRSLILSMDKANFIQMIEFRPFTVLKMVNDMARTIVSLNKKIVELEYKKG